MLYKIIAISTLLMFSGLSYSSNLGFLKDSVLEAFSKQDVTSFKNTVQDSLTHSPDKEVITWESESGRLTGKILPTASYQSNQRACRRVLFEIRETKEKKDRYRFDFCQAGDRWNIVRTPATEFKQSDWQQLGEVLRDSLENDPDGNPVSWVNHSTGHSAVLVPLSTFSKDKQTCRAVTISVIGTNGQTSDGKYHFCKKPDGEWSRHIDSGC